MRRVLVTMGDPAGIGPEVVLRACSTRYDDAEVVAVGSKRVFARVADKLSLTLPSIMDTDAGDEDADSIEPGVMSAAGARIQKAAFARAIEEVAAGRADAVVTAPWTKSLMPLIGEASVGHTEILAERFDRPQHVMMLAGPRLRVSLVTTHTSIRNVPDKVTRERIVEVTTTTIEGLKSRFGVDRPRIAVLGLNPHAGERGEMGREEIDTITPAIDALKSRFEGQAEISGPYPADTLFARYASGGQPFDAVVCMYHDQGLIPLKALHFGEAINITLGLPILRTSVDHGSAYDIAWQGTADAGSMVYAIQSALDMAKRSQ
ncbi:MAG: 4-hydroxythreonine-4-phosphate dehydrogenase PdxA [bacterium]